VRDQPQFDFGHLHLTNGIQRLLREPAVELILDMGLGSREQGFVAHPPKRERFILREQVASAGSVEPCLEKPSPL
jgi:hypothetical protein